MVKIVRKLKPFLASMLYLPKSMLGSKAIKDLEEELTLNYDQVAPDGSIEVIPVKCFDHSIGGYFGIPRYFGLERYSGIKYDDRTVSGRSVAGCYEGLKPIKPRDQQQADYFREIANICKSDSFRDFIAVAGTGTGKTAATIQAAFETQRPMLVLVHTNRLKEQWLGSTELKNGLRFFFGEDFVDNYVGIAQQDRCDYEGKALVIGLIHSVAKRRYPTGFYKYFHSVLLDELHKHTAPAFAGAIMKFPQRIRGGMTATLREDILAQVAHLHFGPVAITSEQKPMQPKVYIVGIKKTISSKEINTYSKATVLTSLTEQRWRNDLLSKLIYQRGFKRKRQVLAISDRVHQLQDIRKSLIGFGVPKGKIGLYTGRIYTGEFRAAIKHKETKERIVLPGKDQWTKDRFGLKKLVSAYFRDNQLNRYDYDITIDENFYTPSDATYRRMERVCSIFLATYGVFEAGNDISRLDMGVEVSPRSDPRQPIGRIVRHAPGKAQPEWYSPTDEITLLTEDGEEELIEELLSQAVSRRRRFREIDAEVVRIKDIEAKLG